jgi:hypothetical protein
MITCTSKISPECIIQNKDSYLFSGKKSPRCSICIKHQISLKNKERYINLIKPKKVKSLNKRGRKKGTKIVFENGVRKASFQPVLVKNYNEI